MNANLEISEIESPQSRSSGQGEQEILSDSEVEMDHEPALEKKVCVVSNKEEPNMLEKPKRE